MIDFPSVTLPLEGIVVTDLTQNVAGPFCTQILADMGAEVVKVERPGRGDDARAWAPPWWGDDSVYFMAFNRNKRSLILDVKAEAGRAVLDRLLQRSDVFVQSLRAGAAGALGLDFAGVRTVNPRIVYCAITAYGPRGPLRDLPGYDPMMQAYAGLMSVNGHPGQEPARVGTSIVDMGTGMWAALGIAGALRQRDATGEAQEVTTALFDTTLMWIGHHAMAYLASGEVPEPLGSGVAMIVPYQAFPTADGWLMIAAPSDAMFGKLCAALEADGLAGDERFADNPSRVRNRGPLVTALSALTREKKTADLQALLRPAGVPCAPILPIDRVLDEPQTRESGMLVPTPHPRLGQYPSVALPIAWNGRRPEPRRPAPGPGEHNDEVLAWLGLSAAEVSDLKAAGIVR